MEIIESMTWVLAGFLPTLAGLELLSRLYRGTGMRKYGRALKLEVIDRC